MAFVKLFHVLFVFVWVGNLLALTRLMGYQVKEDELTQMRMARIYRRMYYFVGLPSMILAVTLGAILIFNLSMDQGISWFVHKLVFAFGLIICDVICGQLISELNMKPAEGRGISFKILHGVVGLLLIGVLTSIYILKP